MAELKEAKIILNEVSLKEIFERLVTLEAKFDIKNTTDNSNTDRFRVLAYSIIFVEAVNFVLNIITLTLIRWH